MILPIIIVLGIVLLDQLSKWLVVVFVKDAPVALIPGVLNFEYAENRGMAFSLLEDHRWIFMTLSCLAIAVLSFYLYKTHKVSKLQNIAVAFIIGGGIGNMIDRIFLGYVVDFVDFCAFPSFWYYTFNVADSFVCVGAGLMILYLLRDIIREMKAEKAAKEEKESEIQEEIQEEKEEISEEDQAAQDEAVEQCEESSTEPTQE